MAKKKLKKAILAGLTAYAASKMLGKGSLKGDASKLVEGDIGGKAKQKFVEDIGSYKHKHLPPMERVPDRIKNLPSGKPSGPKTWRDWLPWKEGGSISASTWKKHGGSIRTEHARVGKMIKAAQGTYAKSGKMLKARHGTEVRTMGSTPHVPIGGSVSIATKLNGTLKTKTF